MVWDACYAGLPDHADKMSFLETTDREAARAIAVVRRRDVDKQVEAQVVRVVSARRCRPRVAAVADIVEAAIAAVARTRSWIPDSTCGTELAGEVYTFVGIAV